MATDRDSRPGSGRGRPPPAGRPGPVRAGLSLLSVLALVLAGAAPACTEDPLTGPGPEEGEDGGAETVEFTIAPEEMGSWRDTTLAGFALASDAPFQVLADRDDFRSRGLVRFPGLPDSVEIDDETLEVEEFLDGGIHVVADTALSDVPSGGLTLRVFALARAFEPDEATWQRAAEGEPWDSAGGDFDRELGILEMEEADAEALADSVEIPLGADTDSLLKAWRASAGQPGIATLTEAEDGELTVSSVFLEFDVRPVGRDTTVTFVAGASLAAVPSTFIFDPPAPPTEGSLRVGGMPAARFYTAFRPPREIDGARLVGSTVNRAEIVFPPAPDPGPFGLPGPVTASALRLAADPFELGLKTPVGDTISGAGGFVLEPDSLAAGRPLRFEITDLLRAWASNPDSAGDLRVGVRLRPDAQTVGFWEFGSASSGAGIRPFLRVVVTPPSDFDGQ